MRQLNTLRLQNSLSAAGLKKIALISMFLDHFAKIPYVYYLQQNGVANYTADPWYILMTSIGRLAFTLFAFLLAEGISHTHDLRQYLSLLLLTAIISQVPYSIAFSGRVWSFRQLNVFFTFAAAIAAVQLLSHSYRLLQNRSGFIRNAAVCAETLAVCILSELLHLEYGIFGIGLVILFCDLRHNRKKMLTIFCIAFAPLYLLHCLTTRSLQQASMLCIRELPGLLSAPLIWIYNGERGKQSKYFYYAFYPLHLLFLLNLCFF